MDKKSIWKMVIQTLISILSLPDAFPFFLR